MTFPAIGISFTAVILTPPSTQFVRGEVVTGKVINERGDFRIRSRGAKAAEDSIDFSFAYQSFFKQISPVVMMKIEPLPDNPWAKHVKCQAGKKWYSRQTSRKGDR